MVKFTNGDSDLLLMRIRGTQKALQLTLFSTFSSSTVNLDGQAKVVCQFFDIC